MKKSVKDPICGMAVDPIKARKNGLFVTKKGKTSYFCSKECMSKFNGKSRPPTEIILSVLNKYTMNLKRLLSHTISRMWELV